MRYGDFPIFLEIAQVIAGYQLESTISAGFNASNTSLENPAPSFLTFGGSALGQGKYTDRPTLIYAPLTGTDFLKRLMTPIPASAVLFMLQSGYAADIVMLLAVSSINGVSSGSKRNGDRPADPQFVRLIQLLREVQVANAIQVRIERAKDGPESTLIALPPSKDPELVAKSAEIRSILGLKSGLADYYGGTGGRGNLDNDALDAPAQNFERGRAAA